MKLEVEKDFYIWGFIWKSHVLLIFHHMQSSDPVYQLCPLRKATDAAYSVVKRWFYVMIQ